MWRHAPKLTKRQNVVLWVFSRQVCVHVSVCVTYVWKQDAGKGQKGTEKPTQSGHRHPASMWWHVDTQKHTHTYTHWPQSSTLCHLTGRLTASPTILTIAYNSHNSTGRSGITLQSSGAASHFTLKNHKNFILKSCGSDCNNRPSRASN